MLPEVHTGDWTSRRRASTNMPMASWRGPRSDGGTTGRTSGAARVRQQPWSDPRLVLGVLLVLGATVLGAYVVSASDDTEPYWALGRDVAAGDPVQRSDLVESRARVGDRAARSFLRTDEELPADLELLRWARTGRAGALVERSALARDGAGTATELPLSVRLGAAPDDLRVGDRVDVWVGPSPEDGADAGEATLALADVPVVEDGRVVGAGGARTVLVDVKGVDLDGATVAALTAQHVTIVRRS